MYLHGGLIDLGVKAATKSLTDSAVKAATNAATKTLTKSLTETAVKSLGDQALKGAVSGVLPAVGGAISTAAGGLSSFASAISSNLPTLLEAYSAFSTTQAAASGATTGAPNAAQPPGGSVTANPVLPGQPTSTALPTATNFLTAPLNIGGVSIPPWTLLAGGVGLLALVFMSQQKGRR